MTSCVTFRLRLPCDSKARVCCHARAVPMTRSLAEKLATLSESLPSVPLAPGFSGSLIYTLIRVTSHRDS